MSTFNRQILFSGTTIFESWPDFVSSSLLSSTVPSFLIETDTSYVVFCPSGSLTKSCVLYKTELNFKHDFDERYTWSNCQEHLNDFRDNYQSSFDSDGTRPTSTSSALLR